MPQLTTLDLQYVSPELLKARNLDLAVPGLYFSTSAIFSLSHQLLYRDVREWQTCHYHSELRNETHSHPFEATASPSRVEG